MNNQKNSLLNICNSNHKYPRRTNSCVIFSESGSFYAIPPKDISWYKPRNLFLVHINIKVALFLEPFYCF